MSKEERKRMVSKDEKLSIRQQCVLLGLCRTSLYYTASEETAENLEIMRLLDRQYAVTPFYGQHRLQAWLAENGNMVNIKRLRRLLGLVQWRTLFTEHRTTVADKKAYKYPYLLKGLDIDHRNQVWELDISYIPMLRGYMYLFAIIDVHTRNVLGWSLSNTMRHNGALQCSGKPSGATDALRSSTETKAASLPRQTMWNCWRATASPSAWTSVAVPWTISSLSGCGAT